MNDITQLNWDYQNPHYLKFIVESKHLDILGHVNNKVYLDWSEIVSWSHSKSLGITPEIYLKLNCLIMPYPKLFKINSLIGNFMKLIV